MRNDKSSERGIAYEEKTAKPVSHEKTLRYYGIRQELVAVSGGIAAPGTPCRSQRAQYVQ